MAAAGIVSIWRYDVAKLRGAIALDACNDVMRTVAMEAVFWQEREAMNEYLLTGKPSVAAEAAAQHARFTQISGLLISDAPAEIQAHAAATAGEAGVFGLFQHLKGSARTTLAEENSAVSQLTASASRVVGPLRAVQAPADQSGAAANAAADSAGRQAGGT